MEKSKFSKSGPGACGDEKLIVTLDRTVIERDDLLIRVH